MSNSLVNVTMPSLACFQQHASPLLPSTLKDGHFAQEKYPPQSTVYNIEFGSCRVGVMRASLVQHVNDAVLRMLPPVPRRLDSYHDNA